MKISHVQHPFIPGMGYQENHLPKEQNRLSHEVAIHTSDYLPSWADDDHSCVSAGVYDVNGVQIIRHKTILDFRSVGKPILAGLNQSLHDFNPDVIHSHGLLSLSTFQAYKYAIKNNIPLFVDVHVDNGNFNLDTVPKKVAFKLYQKFCVPPITEYATKILPVNPQAKRFLKNHFKLSKNKIELLPLGVATDIFTPDRGTDGVRDELGISEDDLLVISAGNLNKSKELEILIKSFTNYVESRDNAKLLLLGKWSESYRTTIESLVTSLGIGNNVILHGPVENARLPLYYNAADIGVWPGKLGITIIEGIGCGLPVIVSDSRATQFLIANNNGFSFPRGDVDTLSSHIESYGSRPRLRSEHATAAREYALNDLDWTEIARQSIYFYEKVV